jgi:nucleotide-binding universal stress UspA family protein
MGEGTDEGKDEGMAQPDERPILAAVDFSPDSEAALARAVGVARETGARLVVLHVIHDPAASPGTYARDDAEGRPMRVEDAAAEMLTEHLAAFRERHPELGGFGPIETHLVSGLPATRIVEVADELDARQIVMGSRGRSGVDKLMHGSVAEVVLQKSSIPVTVVKAAAGA